MRSVCLSLAVAIAGCSAQSETGSGSAFPSTGGNGTDRIFTASGFDSIGLSGVGDVDVRVGSGFAIAATGAAADLDQLEVKQDGHSLNLGFKPGFHSNIGPIHWHVALPRLAAASIGGAGTITVDRVEGNAFEGSIGGSGAVRIGTMRVGKAQFVIGGSGNVSAAGSAKALDVSSGGASTFALTPLRAETASISLAGAGNVAATVTRHADISLVGAGGVTVTGGATCSITNVGGGQVHCS